MDIEKDNEKIILSDNFKIYYQEIIKIPTLSREEEKRLFLENSKDSREKIIKANLRFVILIAKKYERKTISIMDLIQEGNLGLQFAVENFDVSKNVRLETYAYYYIKKYILMYIMEKERKIKLPTGVREDIYRYKRVVNELYMELGRIPTFLEIASRMNLKEKQVKKIFFFLNDAESINSIVKETKNGDEKEVNSLLSSSDSVEDTIFKEEFKRQFYKLLLESKLTKTEINVLINHYGLFNHKKLTLLELANINKVTHQAIYHAEKRALAKLRNSEKIVYLTDYIEKPPIKVKH